MAGTSRMAQEDDSQDIYKPYSRKLAARRIWNPAPGTVHCRELVNYAKDLIPDYIQGVLILAKETKHVHVWEAGLFQWPFVRGVRIRKNIPHVGHPFVDPDGKFMEYEGRVLCGGRGNDDEGAADMRSPFNFKSISKHPGYEAWLQQHLFANKNDADILYQNALGLNNKIACERFINDSTKPKEIGCGTVAQDDSNRVYDASGPMERN